MNLPVTGRGARPAPSALAAATYSTGFVASVFADVFVTAAVLLAPMPAAAQVEYPSRPVRLIVPSSPGGGTDTTARILAPRLGEVLGQPVVVENRPGASLIIGMDVVARAAPDGYTLLIGNSTMTIIPSTHVKLRIDPVRDFAAIGQVVELPQILVGHPSFPARNVKELIAIARQKPGQVDYAAGSYGGSGHMAMELFLNMASIRLSYVPYKSGNAGLADALSGHVPLMMGSVLSALPHVKQGRLRAFGVTTPVRSTAAPEIPTLAEGGVPGYQALQWFGLFAPAGTPSEVLKKVFAATTATVQYAPTRQQLLTSGAEPQLSASSEAFGAMVKAEVVKWAAVVRSAGLKKE
ncbi:MAG: tripartite tricarboxylate transporter substrate binding protein [Proteobacteria bacterium]|jgi:tripartite-type tricarboxylate transporter receptor subunit TctC|nr:tripartite tricarboxylate transporter substrate binding protein [Pseudomonadota bacterium]